MVRELIYILAFFIGVGILSSCQDEPIIEGGGNIPEGHAKISAKVSFKPFGSALNGDSRTAGDAIKEIKSLYVVLYDESGKFVQMFDARNAPDYTDESHNYGVQEPAVGQEHIAESNAPGATFNQVIRYGKYKIYAVANVDITKDEYSEAIKTEAGLKSIQFQWDNTIANNNQMFGFFSTETKNSNVTKPTGFQAPTITIASPTVSLHAWIRRLASKVTVAFDGQKLNENVYIYIHTVQIKDIPNSCYLGKDNTPTENLISNGETIYYRASSSSEEIAGLTITRGTPTGKLNDGSELSNSSEQGGVHHENANSFFFYENMAGTTSTDRGKFQDEDANNVIDYPNGNTEGDVDFKDGVKSGTYIEVKGYYVNKNTGKASQGIITYRFMMGKDVERDCNAERNYHYKLTLKFNNNANDADWHIVYDSEEPGINVANPFYISYVHGEKLDIPVTITGGEPQKLTATIVDNNWEYEGHPYTNDSKNSGTNFNYNGFLTFRNTKDYPLSQDYFETAEIRKSDFTTNSSVTIEQFQSAGGTNDYRLNIPVYTRDVYLNHGFSGNNSYMHKTRSAKVSIVAEVEVDGSIQTFNKEIEIIQVKRVVNPAGVWRPYNKTDDFRIMLMELNEESASGDAFEAGIKDYEPTISDGPWTASIVQGDDWVRIKSLDGDWGTADVLGSTGSKIDFYYKPAGTIGVNETRCGVIKITYHNNTCVHYVFVSQGDAPVTMGTGADAVKWHTKNVKYKGHEVENPVHEGSLFRFHNSEYAIIPENNYRTGFGPFENNFASVTSSYGVFKVIDANGNISERNWPIADDGDNTYIGSRESEYALRINYNGNYARYNNASRGNEFNGIMGNNARVASVEEWNALKSMKRYYGVLYGEYATETKTNPSDMYEYPFDSNGNVVANSQKGMRGMFVWDRDGSKGHIFFPLGSKGHGHRAQFPDWNQSANVVSYREVGTLQYSNMSERMTRPNNDHRPLLIDLYLAWGAIYWCSNWDSANGDDDYSASGGYIVDETGGQNAMDINFNTYDFNTYMEHATWRNEGRIGDFYWDSNYGRYQRYTWHDETYTQSSDACFIRCVEK